MAYLTIIAGDGRTFRQDIDKADIKIGRSSKNDLKLSFDLSLSRFHAEIQCRDGKHYVRDVGSRNGTSLNGRPILEPLELHIGDRVTLGETTILFGVDEEPRIPIEEDARPITADSSTVTIPLDDIISSGPSSPRATSATTPGGTVPDHRFFTVLTRAGMELTNYRPLHEILEVIMDLVFEALPAERGFMMLLEGEPKSLVSKVVRDQQKQSGKKLSLSKTIAKVVVENRQSVLTSDAQADERFKGRESVILQGIHSAMCVPLWNNRAVIGLIYVDTVSAASSFSPEDLKLLTLMANMAAVKIENARLFEVESAKRQMEKDLERASAIQKRLLPGAPPRFEGYDIAGYNDPCHEVGGDYFDYIERGPTKIGLALGDVSGKGLGAALLMATVRASFRAHMQAATGIRNLIASLNVAILECSNPNSFVSFFYCEIDGPTGDVAYVNAGHNPPVLIRSSGSVERLPAGGLILGILPSARYERRDVVLEPGDLLVAFSDGVTETQNEKGEEFGEERLIDLLVRQRASSAGKLQDLVAGALGAFAGAAPQYDDTTLVVLKRND
ncbi:MAG: SpoIIE family protein phosphatase [Acidobacteriota bacterium]